MKSNVLVLCAALLLAACGSGGSSNPDPSPPPNNNIGGDDPPAGGFSYSLSSDLVEAQVITSDGGISEAVQDSEGITSRFIGNEVIITPDDPEQLEDFLQRYQAIVLATDAVPEPPQELGITLTDEQESATSYRVLVDPADFPLDNLISDAEALGLDQSVVISSGDAARLLALVLHEYRNGLNISPNFLFVLDGLLESTREHPEEGGNFFDPFDKPWYNTTGAQTNVTLMWQAVHAAPPPRRVRLAIIDAGFWLDDIGRPFDTVGGGTSDLPENPPQYNFDAGSYFAGGPDEEGGWHGQSVAGIAVAYLDNEYGIAGTGGQVADPVLFSTALNWHQVARAIRTAVHWNADVINLSIGGSCDNVFCDLSLEGNLYAALRNARDNGVIAISSSGNDTCREIDGVCTVANHYVSGNSVVPCKADESICVGATDPDSKRVSNYGNAGSKVDIWAPACIPTIPDGHSPNNLPGACGTSISTPFVAGVVAVMKAYDPSLGLEDVRSILRNTAWTDSPDAEVTHAINAHAAVRAVVDSIDADPYIHIFGTVLDSESNDVPLNRTFTLVAQVYENVHQFIDGEPPCPPTTCPITWSPEPENITSGAVFRLQTVGEIPIIAAGSNSAGQIGASAVIVNVVNQPPQAIVVEPAPGASVFRDEAVQLHGYGLDPNAGPGPEPGVITTGCDWRLWSASPAWEFTSLDCGDSVTFPHNGNFNIRLLVRDAQGAASAPVVQSITVVEPPLVPGPNAGLLVSPPNYLDEYYDRYEPVAVTMTASGNTNTPYTYQMTATSYQEGSTTSVYATANLGTTVSASTSTNHSYNLNNVPGLLLPEAEHNCIVNGQWVRLTLTVLDADSNPGNSASRMIQVLCPLT